MTTAELLEHLRQEAMKLPEPERLQLARDLEESVVASDDVALHPEWRAEIERRVASIKAGLRLLDAVQAALASLPIRWSRLKALKGYESLGVRYVALSKPWPYRLLVVEEAGALHVFALVHDKREPGYWRHRLPP